MSGIATGSTSLLALRCAHAIRPCCAVFALRTSEPAPLLSVLASLPPCWAMRGNGAGGDTAGNRCYACCVPGSSHLVPCNPCHLSSLALTLHIVFMPMEATTASALGKRSRSEDPADPDLAAGRSDEGPARGPGSAPGTSHEPDAQSGRAAKGHRARAGPDEQDPQGAEPQAPSPKAEQPTQEAGHTPDNLGGTTRSTQGRFSALGVQGVAELRLYQ